MNTRVTKQTEQVEVTKTAETCQAYLRTAERLLERSGSGKPGAGINQVSILIQWLEEMARQWRPATKRLYRSSLVYVFTQIYENVPSTNKSDEARTEIKRLLDFLGEPFSTIRGKDLPMRTSAQKRKFLTANERALLLAVLHEDSRSEYALPLIAYILAGEAVGLRPSEWLQARLANSPDSDSILLIVRNLKTTNGRGTGEMRSLNLDGVSNTALIAIRDLVALFRKHTTKEGRTIIAGMRKHLYRVCKELWPDEARRICLYTQRHQYSANGKAGKFSPTKLAAAMGHASPETAKEHYGRRGKGRRGLLNKNSSEADLVGIAEPCLQDCLQLKACLDAKQATADAQKQVQPAADAKAELAAADAQLVGADSENSEMSPEDDGGMEP